LDNLDFTLEKLEFALEKLTERGESDGLECMLVRVEFVLGRPTERSEYDIPLTRARRAPFDVLEFTLERLTDRVERAALDTLELRLKPPTERNEGPAERDKLDALEFKRNEGPAERDKLDALEFTRVGCSLEFVLDRLAERAQLGLVSLLEGRDSDSRCVGLDAPNCTGHENCVGYQP
jgi:hypothetical protein